MTARIPLVLLVAASLGTTVFAQAPPSSKTTTRESESELRGEFARIAGAKLVFDADELPPGEYHDEMPSLAPNRRITAAKIAIAEARKLPPGFLKHIGMKCVGIFEACVSKTGDGFRPYDKDLKGYRYFGIWNGKDAMAGAFYTEGQLPLTLQHEIFHHVDSVTRGPEAEPFAADARWNQVIEGTNRYPAIQIADDDLAALRKAARGVVLEDAVSEYAAKNPGEDKAETARYLMSHLADSLVQMALRPELPGSQRLLHILAKYEQASSREAKADTAWFVDRALGRAATNLVANDETDSQVAELRKPVAHARVPEVRQLLRGVSPLDANRSSELLLAAITATHAILRADLAPIEGDTVFTIRGQEDKDGINWTLRKALADYRADAEHVRRLAGALPTRESSSAKIAMKNLRLLARFRNFIAGQWTITPETGKLFDQTRDAMIAAIPDSHGELKKQLIAASYKDLAENIQAEGLGFSSSRPAATNPHLRKVDKAIADPEVRAAIRAVQPACVRINNGSGVNIASAGRILTNAHVADRIGATMSAEFPDGRKFTVRCVAIDKKLDLAICECESDESLPFATVAATAPKTGTAVVCIGQPGTRTPEGEPTDYQPFHVSTGKIRGYLENPLGEQTLGRMKHDAWTYWGHSGSPLFDSTGKIVGLHNSWDSTTAMRHGVPQQAIAAFLKKSR